MKNSVAALTELLPSLAFSKRRARNLIAVTGLFVSTSIASAECARCIHENGSAKRPGYWGPNSATYFYHNQCPFDVTAKFDYDDGTEDELDLKPGQTRNISCRGSQNCQIGLRAVVCHENSGQGSSRNNNFNTGPGGSSQAGRGSGGSNDGEGARTHSSACGTGMQSCVATCGRSYGCSPTFDPRTSGGDLHCPGGVAPQGIKSCINSCCPEQCGLRLPSARLPMSIQSSARSNWLEKKTELRLRSMTRRGLRRSRYLLLGLNLELIKIQFSAE